MIVSKFGGTSVGSAKNIAKVVEIVSKKPKNNIVVVSAIGGITNLLIKSAYLAKNADDNYIKFVNQIEDTHLSIIKDLISHRNQNDTIQDVKLVINALKDRLHSVFTLRDLSAKSEASIISTGEILSSKIIYNYMRSKNLEVTLFDAKSLIKANGDYLNAQVDYNNTYYNLKKAFSKNQFDIALFPGFIASNNNNDITTLGRGGSDYTAALLANVIDADVLEIWTDVSGLYTANPKLVKQAMPIPQISYEEAMELSYFGAKVIYPPTIQPALNKSIPIAIKNTLKPEEKGSLISENITNKSEVITGISHIDHIAMLTLQGNGMVGVPGISKRFFEALLMEKINVIFITQASSEHSISVAVDLGVAEKAKQVIDAQFAYEILQKQIDPMIVEKDLAIIALVGDQMKSHQGISGKMFSHLGHNNVNIRAIAQGSTERNISAVINKKAVKKAFTVLHAAFFEDHIKQINLFVVGVGNVGAKLLEQIKQQQSFLKKQLHIDLRVVGISNSKTMLFNNKGIHLDNWLPQLKSSEFTTSFDGFFNHVKDLNLRNSVFVDTTANNDLPNYYQKYLKQSIAVVACNKVACSSDFENYQELKKLSRQYSAPFLFETNVGAGLPIIDTLKNLINSGDRVTKIQAVLSGSLNFIFNNYVGQDTFKDIVLKAGEEGYTEHDPRIDLSGIDVARKILILIRESGIKMELDHITNNSFLPKTSQQADSVSEFIETLGREEAYFQELYNNAHQRGCRLKYVAEFNDGKANVGLQEIPSTHDFYNLDGKDNIVLFYTDRYQEQPLIVKGAGAGAEVTASGIFGDIIRTVNQ